MLCTFTAPTLDEARAAARMFDASRPAEWRFAGVRSKRINGEVAVSLAYLLPVTIEGRAA